MGTQVEWAMREMRGEAAVWGGEDVVCRCVQVRSSETATVQVEAV